MAKATTDDQKRIDVRERKRKGFLTEGKRNWNWVNEDGTTEAISVETQQSRVVLRYCATEISGKSEEIELPISIDQTNASRGGVRLWFLCPGCGKRVAILYLGKYYFRCRHCLGLVYRSQKISASQRASMRSKEIAWGGNP